MITCPSCSHQNPDGATHCEACYTPLPVITMIVCPSCSASVQSDASFCGHCGFDLTAKTTEAIIRPQQEVPEPLPSPIQVPEPAPEPVSAAEPDPFQPVEITPDDLTEISTMPVTTAPTVAAVPSSNPKTQLQRITASLLHVQTNVTLELPNNLQVTHLGKPNNLIPPDIDVSGFPDSDIVSRVHADIRFEGDAFYFEDTGSSNGTYINNVPLPAGNRHRLRAGDRISLGKGDKVSFIFQMTE